MSHVFFMISRCSCPNLTHRLCNGPGSRPKTERGTTWRAFRDLDAAKFMQFHWELDHGVDMS